MGKMEVLQLLQSLLYRACLPYTAADDPSGISTVYYVDHEQLMRNLEAELEKEQAIQDQLSAADDY